MKKIFISQPMNGKTDEFILTEREKAIKAAKDYFEDDFEVIDSLKFMADADVVVLARDWQDYRGCKIEPTCAFEYGADVMEL